MNDPKTVMFNRDDITMKNATSIQQAFVEKGFPIGQSRTYILGDGGFPPVDTKISCIPQIHIRGNEVMFIETDIPSDDGRRVDKDGRSI